MFAGLPVSDWQFWVVSGVFVFVVVCFVRRLLPRRGRRGRVVLTVGGERVGKR